ncbi:MAG: hypothetical protein KJS98_14190 [Nitrospirae bacterium]|nr:hypothetical protein [Nitrospirota bacterium]
MDRRVLGAIAGKEIKQLLDRAAEKLNEHSGMMDGLSIADAARTVRRIFKKIAQQGRNF